MRAFGESFLFLGFPGKFAFDLLDSLDSYGRFVQQWRAFTVSKLFFAGEAVVDSALTDYGV